MVRVGVLVAYFLIGIGLLRRNNLARRTIVFGSILMLILSFFVWWRLYTLQNLFGIRTASYHAYVDSLDRSKLTSADRQYIAKLDQDLTELEHQVGKQSNLSYASLAADQLIFAGIAIYLTRPGVKSAFR